MKKIIISVVVGAVVLGGIFYSGMKYGGRRNSGARIGQFAARTGADGARIRTGGEGALAGEILSRDAKGFVLKLADGGSKIVFTSDSMAITKTSSGSLDDLKTGASVFVTGTVNADGSTTATSVRLGGILMFRSPTSP